MGSALRQQGFLLLDHEGRPQDALQHGDPEADPHRHQMVCQAPRRRKVTHQRTSDCLDSAQVYEALAQLDLVETHVNVAIVDATPGVGSGDIFPVDVSRSRSCQREHQHLV